jgi:hypothetical protein
MIHSTIYYPSGITKEDYEKKYESANVHFCERIKDRYGIDFTANDYYSLTHTKKYQGKFSKNTHLTVGILTLRNQKIWALYNNKYKLFLTVYPKIIEMDVGQMIRACFPKALLPIANDIFLFIKREINSARVDFLNDKDAAIYYFNECNFSTLLIEKFKYGEPSTIKYCNEIKKIIEGTHRKAKLSVITKQ